MGIDHVKTDLLTKNGVIWTFRLRTGWFFHVKITIFKKNAFKVII